MLNDSSPGWQVGDLVFLDAYGNRCRAPMLCWTCQGSGVDWGETCLECGGLGKRCEKDTSDAK